MKIKLEGDLVFYENGKMNRIFQVTMIRNNQHHYLGEREKEAFFHIKDFIIENHAELLL